MKTIEQIRDEIEKMKKTLKSELLHPSHQQDVLLQITTLEWVLDASIS